jgi:hypothetical protein
MPSSEQRQQNRTSRNGASALKVTLSRPAGGSDEIPARLVDSTSTGIGIETGLPLGVGSSVFVTSNESLDGRIGAHKAYVRWCAPVRGGAFQSGLEFDDTAEPASNGKGREETKQPEDETTPDYYEILQLSSKADMDTIHRVFRVLAQRYHPDNLESGDEGVFRQVMSAYEVLSNPERRAAFDARRVDNNKARWRIFNQSQAMVGMEAEKSKRQGILSLLYAKRLAEPRQPLMSILEFEELLDCPREHLEFTLWYLRENGLISRSDNARFSITVKGVDYAEENGAPPPTGAKLLPSAGQAISL